MHKHQCMIYKNLNKSYFKPKIELLTIKAKLNNRYQCPNQVAINVKSVELNIKIIYNTLNRKSIYNFIGAVSDGNIFLNSLINLQKISRFKVKKIM